MSNAQQVPSVQTEPEPTIEERLRNAEENYEKYYVKARVYGAIANRFRQALDAIVKIGPAQPDAANLAHEALAWRYSERGGVPMTAIEEMDRLLRQGQPMAQGSTACPACTARTLTNRYVIERPWGERITVVGRIVGILEYDVQRTEQETNEIRLAPNLSGEPLRPTQDGPAAREVAPGPREGGDVVSRPAVSALRESEPLPSEPKAEGWWCTVCGNGENMVRRAPGMFVTCAKCDPAEPTEQEKTHGDGTRCAARSDARRAPLANDGREDGTFAPDGGSVAQEPADRAWRAEDARGQDDVVRLATVQRSESITRVDAQRPSDVKPRDVPTLIWCARECEARAQDSETQAAQIALDAAAECFRDTAEGETEPRPAKTSPVFAPDRNRRWRTGSRNRHTIYWGNDPAGFATLPEMAQSLVDDANLGIERRTEQMSATPAVAPPDDMDLALLDKAIAFLRKALPDASIDTRRSETITLVALLQSVQDAAVIEGERRAAAAERRSLDVSGTMLPIEKK